MGWITHPVAGTAGCLSNDWESDGGDCAYRDGLDTGHGLVQAGTIWSYLYCSGPGRACDDGSDEWSHAGCPGRTCWLPDFEWDLRALWDRLHYSCTECAGYWSSNLYDYSSEDCDGA